MKTELTLPIRSDGGDLLWTFTCVLDVPGFPLIPDGTILAIEGHEFPARCYLDLDDMQYCVLLAQDYKFEPDRARIMADRLKQRGWQCAYEKGEK